MKNSLKTLALLMALALLAAPALAQSGGIKEQNLSPELDLLVNDGLMVRNATGSTLAAAQLVYVCGYLETSGGYVKHQKVCAADADTAGARAMYILPRAITNGADGQALKQTRLTAVNTNGSTVGNPVYLSATAGSWTLTAPASPAVNQVVGRVAAVSATIGQIEINIEAESPTFGASDLAAGSVLPSKQGLVVRAGSALAAGDLVYLSSYNATDGVFVASLADSNVANGKAQYVATGTIGSGSTGTVVRSATVAFVTTGASVGDPVYLTTTGTTGNTMSLAAPSAGDDVIQVIGRVTIVTVGVGTGRVLVDLSSLPYGVASGDIQASSVSSAKITDDTIVNADVNSAAAIVRTKLATEVGAVFGVEIDRLLQTTGIPLVASETAGNFNVSVAANVILAQGEITDNETEASVVQYQFVLPLEYVAGALVTVRIPCALVLTGAAVDNASTVDVAVYEQTNGAVGADLSTTTAAATFAALDTWYNKDFVITPTDLVAGDVLNVVITSNIVDSEAGAGTLRFNMAPPRMLLNIKG